MTLTPFRWRTLRKKREESEPRYRCNTVTCCIASIYSNSAIIAVSDKRITFSGMVSTEGEMTKALTTSKWIGMIAGENISAAVPMLNEVDSKDDGTLTVEQFSVVCREAYRHQQTMGIESTILSKYDMTLKQFKESGSRVFTDKVYEHLIEGMEEYDLGAQFLFAGFDPRCAPHIFTLTHPGKVQFFDRTGYWAVGSGKHAAISHLAGYPYRRHATFAECIYQTIAAKFAAESATDVGRDTDVSVRFRDLSPTLDLPEDLVEYVRGLYERIERVPGEAIRAIDAEMRRFDLSKEKYKDKPHNLGMSFPKMLTPREAEVVVKAHNKMLNSGEKKKTRPSKPRTSAGQP